MEDEGVGDSDGSPAVEPTDEERIGNPVPLEPLAEGDSGSSTSSPVSSPVEDPVGPTNVRRRRVHVESESAKRARLEL